MGTYELISNQPDSGIPQPSGERGLGSAVLLHNAQWFTKVRWIIAAMFVVAGLAGKVFPNSFKSLGVTIPSIQLWILAGILLSANLVFHILVRRISEESSPNIVRANIWVQISLDLLVVTYLVHTMGSTDTFMGFTYLFHIALACIFFVPRRSLIVTLLAAVLYLTLIILEIAEILPAADIFIELKAAPKKSPALTLVFAFSAVIIWLVVWYLVSTISDAVRKRDQILTETNKKLIKANQEKNQQMLVTTHDLKAPFAGIESNIQLIKYQFWDEVPPSIQSIIERIDLRAQTLRERIKDILILGDLRSHALTPKPSVPVDIQEVLKRVQDELSERAKSRKIAVHLDVSSMRVNGDLEQFVILFSNLVANAISYSFEGGRIDVSSEKMDDGVHVRVRDYGIGIREDALPHIFDEFYRTKEATRFNRLSTGLGLTIVKTITQNFNLRIRVKSELEKGTEFEVIIAENTKYQQRGV